MVTVDYGSEMGFQDGVETSWDLQLIRPGAGHQFFVLFSPSDLISELVFWQESWELEKGVSRVGRGVDGSPGPPASPWD